MIVLRADYKIIGDVNAKAFDQSSPSFIARSKGGLAPLSRTPTGARVNPPLRCRSVSFRETLEQELGRRRARNPRYSLRAFARALEFDHATLSKLLRGQRRATTRTIRQLGSVLRLSPHEIERHCGEANDEALLGVIGTDLFRADSRWLATVLGIPIDEVNMSLQRLVRLRALRMTAAQQWEVLA